MSESLYFDTTVISETNEIEARASPLKPKLFKLFRSSIKLIILNITINRRNFTCSKSFT